MMNWSLSFDIFMRDIAKFSHNHKTKSFVNDETAAVGGEPNPDFTQDKWKKYKVIHRSCCFAFDCKGN